MTKLTNDNAFNGIFHRYITPNIDSMIINMDIRIIIVDHKSNPRRINITIKVAAILRLRLNKASPVMCKYPSYAV